MIKVEIIKDSINVCGNRLTTFVLEYPRWIHAELLTHRVFSKNSASSRAIPFEKFVQQIQENPAMPVFWGKNQKGMQAIEELNDIKHHYIVQGNLDGFYSDMDLAKFTWLAARDKAIEFAEQLNKLEVHKQIVNRILEPWFHIRVILSGTEFENFFALRAHKDAQPEFQKLAHLMLDEYNKSTPKLLKSGEWHIPFGDNIDEERLNTLPSVIEEMNKLDKAGCCGDHSTHYMAKQQIKKKIAVARCARVSYYNYEGKNDYEADIKLCDRLFANSPKHLSPTEHIAMALDTSEWSGNFKGFKQYRKFFSDENLKDNRIIPKNEK